MDGSPDTAGHSAAPDREILRERSDRDVCWTVWREGDVVVKEYRLLQWPGRWNRRWRREHRALLRLNRRRVPAPRTYGYRRAGPARIQYRRQFLAGRVGTPFDPTRIRQLSAHLAALHAAGVTHGDVSPDNLLLTDSGELLFIDYGRSHVFPTRSPCCWFYAGKDLARVRRRLLPADAAGWADFLAAYLHASTRPLGFHSLARWSLLYWLRRWKIPLTGIEAGLGRPTP